MSPRLPVATETDHTEARGVRCPLCAARTEVIDIDPMPEGRNWRRRQCARCGCRFSTNETIDQASIQPGHYAN